MSTTANRLTIKRGAAQIADGLTARVLGVPLGSCERAVEVFDVAGALSCSILDLATRRRSFTFDILRQHGSTQDAMRHGMLAPQGGVMRADFVIGFNDGTDDHLFTAAGAAWQTVGIRESDGGTVLSYSVTCGPLTWSLNGTPTAYDDSLTPAVVTGAVQIYRGADLIADGSEALVEGVPLASVESAQDIYDLALGSMGARDYGTQTRRVPITIRRAFGSDSVAAIKHALLAPDNSAVVEDLEIRYFDGTLTHKWIATDSAWRTCTPQDATGTTLMAYDITCPRFAYSVDDVAQDAYSDALNTLYTYLRPGGVDTYLRPDGYAYLRP